MRAFPDLGQLGRREKPGFKGDCKESPEARMLRVGLNLDNVVPVVQASNVTLLLTDT